LVWFLLAGSGQHGVWWVTRAKDNMKWSPRSVCDLYRRRWDIEVFFKQVKQSLKLGSFLGHRANAVRWQVYTALLVYVVLRFKAQGSSCPVCGTAVIFFW
jgi:IS4 transposase